MNYRIADTLAEGLIDLPYISLATGCVQTIVKHSKKQGEIKFPAAEKYYFDPAYSAACVKDEDYQPFTPDSKQAGIVFFEDLGSKEISSSSHRAKWQGELKLICWINRKKIGYDKVAVDIMENLMVSLPNSLQPNGMFFGGPLSIVEIYSKRPGPFEKYDLDEKQKQFLIKPFDYFALKLKYTVFTSSGCPVGPITISEETC